MWESRDLKTGGSSQALRSGTVLVSERLTSSFLVSKMLMFLRHRPLSGCALGVWGAGVCRAHNPEVLGTG